MVKSQGRSDGLANDSVICHFSKYIPLAMTDFNKFRVFDRKCTLLELSQLKEITKGNARKLAVNFTDLVTQTSQKPEKSA